MAIIYQKTPPAVVAEVKNSSTDVVLENVDIKEEVVESEAPGVDHDTEDEQTSSENSAGDPTNDVAETIDLPLIAQQNPAQYQTARPASSNSKKKKR